MSAYMLQTMISNFTFYQKTTVADEIIVLQPKLLLLIAE
jgi:hypothetical protein